MSTPNSANQHFPFREQIVESTASPPVTLSPFSTSLSPLSARTPATHASNSPLYSPIQQCNSKKELEASRIVRGEFANSEILLRQENAQAEDYKIYRLCDLEENVPYVTPYGNKIEKFTDQQAIINDRIFIDIYSTPKDVLRLNSNRNYDSDGSSAALSTPNFANLRTPDSFNLLDDSSGLDTLDNDFIIEINDLDSNDEGSDGKPTNTNDNSVPTASVATTTTTTSSNETATAISNHALDVNATPLTRDQNTTIDGISEIEIEITDDLNDTDTNNNNTSNNNGHIENETEIEMDYSSGEDKENDVNLLALSVPLEVDKLRASINPTEWLVSPARKADSPFSRQFIPRIKEQLAVLTQIPSAPPSQLHTPVTNTPAVSMAQVKSNGSAEPKSGANDVADTEPDIISSSLDFSKVTTKRKRFHTNQEFFGGNSFASSSTIAAVAARGHSNPATRLDMPPLQIEDDIDEHHTKPHVVTKTERFSKVFNNNSNNSNSNSNSNKDREEFATPHRVNKPAMKAFGYQPQLFIPTKKIEYKPRYESTSARTHISATNNVPPASANKAAGSKKFRRSYTDVEIAKRMDSTTPSSATATKKTTAISLKQDKVEQQQQQQQQQRANKYRAEKEPKPRLGGTGSLKINAEASNQKQKHKHVNQVFDEASKSNMTSGTPVTTLNHSLIAGRNTSKNSLPAANGQHLDADEPATPNSRWKLLEWRKQRAAEGTHPVPQSPKDENPTQSAGFTSMHTPMRNQGKSAVVSTPAAAVAVATTTTTTPARSPANTIMTPAATPVGQRSVSPVINTSTIEAVLFATAIVNDIISQSLDQVSHKSSAVLSIDTASLLNNNNDTTAPSPTPQSATSSPSHGGDLNKDVYCFTGDLPAACHSDEKLKQALMHMDHLGGNWKARCKCSIFASRTDVAPLYVETTRGSILIPRNSATVWMYKVTVGKERPLPVEVVNHIKTNGVVWYEIAFELDGSGSEPTTLTVPREEFRPSSNLFITASTTESSSLSKPLFVEPTSSNQVAKTTTETQGEAAVALSPDEPPATETDTIASAASTSDSGSAATTATLGAVDPNPAQEASANEEPFASRATTTSTVPAAPAAVAGSTTTSATSNNNNASEEQVVIERMELRNASTKKKKKGQHCGCSIM